MPHQTPPAPPPGSPASPMPPFATWRGLAFGFLLGVVASAVVMIMVAGFASRPVDIATPTPSITAIEPSAHPAEMSNLRLGDCTLETGDLAARYVETVSCKAPHHYEVYHVTEVFLVDFPGDIDMGATADRICVEAFGRFVGRPIEESSYDVTVLRPTQETWALGERTIRCLIGKDTDRIEGTLRQSRR